MAANLARRGAGDEVARLLELDERARALRKVPREELIDR